MSIVSSRSISKTGFTGCIRKKSHIWHSYQQLSVCSRRGYQWVSQIVNFQHGRNSTVCARHVSSFLKLFFILQHSWHAVRSDTTLFYTDLPLSLKTLKLLSAARSKIITLRKAICLTSTGVTWTLTFTLHSETVKLLCCTCKVIIKHLFGFVSYFRPVQLLQCVHNPDHTDCRLCTNSTAIPWNRVPRTPEEFRYLCVKLGKMWLHS